MVVLITCKNEEDPIISEEARVATWLYVNFSDIPGHSIDNVGIWQNFEFIRAFMHVLITCKNKEDSIKNEGVRVAKTYFPLLVYGNFTRCSRVANSVVHHRIWPKFELCRDFMVVLVSCKK